MDSYYANQNQAPLPSNWSQHWDESQGQWYYQQNDVYPPYISYDPPVIQGTGDQYDDNSNNNSGSDSYYGNSPQVDDNNYSNPPGQYYDSSSNYNDSSSYSGYNDNSVQDSSDNYDSYQQPQNQDDANALYQAQQMVDQSVTDGQNAISDAIW